MDRKKILFGVVLIFLMGFLGTAPAGARMVKEVCIGVYENAPNEAAIEMDYLLFHGPQIADLSGAWMSSYKLWLPYEPPEDAVKLFNAVRGRYAELWFTEDNYRDRPGMEQEKPLKPDPSPRDEKGPYQFEVTRPERRVVMMVPAKPTQTFYTWRAAIDNRTVIRWVTAIRYPEGVSVEEGEDWFLNVHAREACEQPGLLKFTSYRAIDEYTHSFGGERAYVRVNEYWYKDFDAWRNAVIKSPPKYTKPSWGGEYPFVEMQSTFIPYIHYVDFLEGGYIAPRQ